MLQQVFPDYPTRTHMPFTDGRVLLFCAAREPIEHSFHSRGSGWGCRATRHGELVIF